ncbi:MAG TPA: RDD family protein [Smithella sp.]|nr:RDD family protein [Smithella sp.]
MTIYKYAGFWRRFVAFSIDSTIAFFIFIFLLTIASLAFFSGAISGNSQDILVDLADPAGLSPFIIFTCVFFIFTNLAYFTYFHGATGRTPGKMLLGLQVVSDDGSNITFGIAFLRAVGYFVSNILYLGFIWVAFDKKKQGWHDKIAGTVVIIRERENKTEGIFIPDSPTVRPEARQQMQQHEESEEQNNQPDKVPENKD